MRALADLVGLVDLEAVQRQLVLFGEDGDGADGEFIGGAQDADGDFGAVGDEQLADFCQSATTAVLSGRCRACVSQPVRLRKPVRPGNNLASMC